MERLRTIQRWLDAHYDLAYALIRFYLGAALFVRGWVFIGDSSLIMELAEQQNVDWSLPVALIHYVAIAHLIGGLMLAAGLYTRLAALVQLPILVGAVFLIHFEQGLASTGQSLELSALVLFLLAVFFVFGSGSYAFDNYVDRAEGERRPEERVPVA